MKMPRLPSIGEHPGQARPISLDVSFPELLALVKFHAAEVRKLKGRTGKVLLENVFSMRDTRTVTKVAMELCDHHGARIKGLSALAREFAGKQKA